jgi:hypothetical protein
MIKLIKAKIVGKDMYNAEFAYNRKQQELVDEGHL